MPEDTISFLDDDMEEHEAHVYDDDEGDFAYCRHCLKVVEVIIQNWVEQSDTGTQLCSCEVCTECRKKFDYQCEEL